MFITITRSVVISILLLACSTSQASETDFTLVSQNLRHFYDDQPNSGKGKVYSSRKYKKRLNSLINKISTDFKLPDIIAFQEIENRSILQQISRQLQKRQQKSYRSVLIEGNDISGMDVGFLIDKKFQIKSTKALFQHQKFNKNRESLFSRPPLAVELCLKKCITIINVHLRSMRGLKKKRHSRRVSLKRLSQAETLANWIDKTQNRLPEKKLIVVGDFNALTPSDSFVDSLGTIIGNPDQNLPRWKSPDLIRTDLINTSLLVKPAKRFSYRYKKSNQLLDYLLISENWHSNIQSIEYSTIDYHFSDHAAILAKISFPDD